MKNKKNITLLICSILLLLVFSIFSYYSYQNSYLSSKEIGQEMTALQKTITAINDGNQSGDVDALSAQKAVLANEKLALEKPYSYGLTLAFFSLLLLIKSIYNLAYKKAVKLPITVQQLAQAGLCAALCYIGFAFFKIDIPVGPEKTAFHLGNVFCVLAALLLGGYLGGLSGAVGMTIADLTTAYVTSAPKTFLLKLCIGLIVSFVAHNIFKLSKSHKKSYVIGVTFLASFCGMGFNVIADPLVGYFYKTYLLGVPQDISAALQKIATITTSVNAVIAIFAATFFYLVLRPALKKANLLVQLTPEEAPEQ